MNTRTDILAAQVERFLRPVGKPARWASPGLASAIGQLAGYGLRQPDVTLDELRVALIGTGFTWATGGILAVSRGHSALVDELERLIETCGRNTRVAELFLLGQRVTADT